MANKPIILSGITTHHNDEWQILFCLLPVKRGWKRYVTFKNLRTKQKLYARNEENVVQMLQIWGYEFWPEFARPLADRVMVSEQLPLFKDM